VVRRQRVRRSGGARVALIEDCLRRPFSSLEATFHESLVVERAVLAGEVYISHRLADLHQRIQRENQELYPLAEKI
jgi:hypothetical protein